MVKIKFTLLASNRGVRGASAESLSRGVAIDNIARGGGKWVKFARRRGAAGARYPRSCPLKVYRPSETGCAFLKRRRSAVVRSRLPVNRYFYFLSSFSLP
ncbi:hypothetical protein EVAR_59485_1 [Eumeta japonica]|uniref:Uncharacterized protein n=1 Tax=Eumeta variegata TaxID=151549 RepID=A0A4C1YHM7_EUMVA|nr:hypothetical protein EVAR_59485_1 [Eumeta japonica]